MSYNCPFCGLVSCDGTIWRCPENPFGGGAPKSASVEPEEPEGPAHAPSEFVSEKPARLAADKARHNLHDREIKAEANLPARKRHEER